MQRKNICCILAVSIIAIVLCGWWPTTQRRARKAITNFLKSYGTPFTGAPPDLTRMDIREGNSFQPLQANYWTIIRDYDGNNIAANKDFPVSTHVIDQECLILYFSRSWTLQKISFYKSSNIAQLEHGFFSDPMSPSDKIQSDDKLLNDIQRTLNTVEFENKLKATQEWLWVLRTNRVNQWVAEPWLLELRTNEVRAIRLDNTTNLTKQVCYLTLTLEKGQERVASFRKVTPVQGTLPIMEWK
jgi:hypothetical protein